MSNLFVIAPDKHSRDPLVMCDAVRPHYPLCQMWASWASPTCLVSVSGALESIYSRQNTEGAAVSQGLGTCCWPGPGPNVTQIVFDVGHFDRNRCPPAQCWGLIWTMTLSPSPSNTSLTRQLGLCSTGGNRLGDWSRGGCENISLNTFSRNTKTAIPSDGIAFSLNSRQAWDCGCKEFPPHCSLPALLSSDHNSKI